MSLRDKLRRPFPVDRLSHRPGPGGITLTYIDARDVMQRLDDTVGIDGWQTHFIETPSGRIICELKVLVDEGEWITKSDGAGDTGIEGEKGAMSDAFKRAAVSYGIGRYLYRLGGMKQGQALPEWATPEGFDRLIGDGE